MTTYFDKLFRKDKEDAEEVKREPRTINNDQTVKILLVCLKTVLVLALFPVILLYAVVKNS